MCDTVCVCAPVCFACVHWQAELLVTGTVMATVPDDVCARFITALTSEWLPGKHVRELLFRGSVHGMTPTAFHEACDGKGATLTLIRAAANGPVPVGAPIPSFVFGGYTSRPWELNIGYTFCGDAFLFSVTSPHEGGPVTQFPLKPGQEMFAMMCTPSAGPEFGDWMLHAGGVGATFGPDSSCSVGRFYQDVLSKGCMTFTGTYKFTPTEIETFLVK